MPEEDEILKRAVIRLNANLLGTVIGLLMGGGLFLATIILVLKGGPTVGQHLVLLSQFYPGYRVTFLGGFIGFFYGFVTGFLIGVVVGVVYNQIAKV